ncbi:unnamed protein product (macronuclear) [Paramecium tetraurelia]|uniref:Palmitoyltransferase n=1 Tax=Paramecium tetraurelia TaxID=5888 RepID=A0BYH0_PARTE|nr:uncharacterized protein GSPATT00033440001 [Paramecium tetraurelia]CAK63587.1 unnamed protein product [Paramecium tetraurelia]|eukprot:XP_001430985.1 hypothetical protein (macronuclear) [Paramecium tetraurelia strain d4-2]
MKFKSLYQISFQIKHFFIENDLEIKYTLSLIMLVDSIIFSMLLLQLFIFHIYLIINGITTYEFIVTPNIKKINPQINILRALPEVIPKAVPQTQLIFHIDHKNTIIELNSSEQQMIQEPQDKHSNSNEIVFNNQILA